MFKTSPLALLVLAALAVAPTSALAHDGDNYYGSDQITAAPSAPAPMTADGMDADDINKPQTETPENEGTETKGCTTHRRHNKGSERHGRNGHNANCPSATSATELSSAASAPAGSSAPAATNSPSSAAPVKVKQAKPAKKRKHMLLYVLKCKSGRFVAVPLPMKPTLRSENTPSMRRALRLWQRQMRQRKFSTCAAANRLH